MDQDAYFPGRSVFVLPVKDALRGTRAILKQAGWALTPEPPGRKGGTAEQQLSFTEEFARNTSLGAFEISQLLKVDHGSRTGPLSGFEQFADSERAAACFARIYRRGMIFAFARMALEPFLISETLAAAAYWSGLRKVSHEDATALLAAHLYRSLVRHHVAGTAPGTPLGLDDNDLDAIKLATFAVMLWLLIERPQQQENEDEILGLCADIVTSLRADIERSESDTQALARLMASYADVI